MSPILDILSPILEILSPTIVETLSADVEMLSPIGEILSLIWAILSPNFWRDTISRTRRIPASICVCVCLFRDCVQKRGMGELRDIPLPILVDRVPLVLCMMSSRMSRKRSGEGDFCLSSSTGNT